MCRVVYCCYFYCYCYLFYEFFSVSHFTNSKLSFSYSWEKENPVSFSLLPCKWYVQPYIHKQTHTFYWCMWEREWVVCGILVMSLMCVINAVQHPLYITIFCNRKSDVEVDRYTFGTLHFQNTINCNAAVAFATAVLLYMPFFSCILHHALLSFSLWWKYRFSTVFSVNTNSAHTKNRLSLTHSPYIPEANVYLLVCCA